MWTPDPHFMQIAFDEAIAAGERGEVPIGAVIVRDNQMIASSGNQTIADNDPTAHAEILAIRKACHLLGNYRLLGCDLYVTLEPCAMCAAAISFARIRQLNFAAFDPKGGGVEHGPCFFHQATCHWRPKITGGIRENDASDLLKKFFAARRK